MAKLNDIKRAYGTNGGYIDVFPEPIVVDRAPTTSDTAEVGTIWIYQGTTDSIYVLT